MENEIYIRELLVKEHFGDITEDEQLALDAILAASEEARALREEIRSIPTDEAIEHMNHMDDEYALHELHERHHRFVNRQRIKRIAAFAIVTGAIFAGVYLWITPKEIPTTIAETIHDDGSATLQLANGKVIRMLDSGSQQIEAGQATVSNNNRVLSFEDQKGPADGWNTLTVPPKLDYQVVLSDGTKVWLNSTSRIRFPFAFKGRQREVYVEGEAYFDIKHNAEQPFMVHAGQADVLVLGTEFNVNAYTPTRVITSLVKGKVSIKEKILQPGKEAIVGTGKDVLIQDFDAAYTLSWRQGIHYFSDASIHDMAAMLSRWYDTQVIIDNPEVAKVRLRGKLFRNEPIQSFLDKLNATGDVVFYWEGKVLHCK